MGNRDENEQGRGWVHVGRRDDNEQGRGWNEQKLLLRQLDGHSGEHTDRQRDL